MQIKQPTYKNDVSESSNVPIKNKINLMKSTCAMYHIL